MKSESREKLSSWFHRPRGSFGVVMGVVSFVLLFSVATWLESEIDPLMAHPSIVLLFVACSTLIGIAVQHQYTLLIGKSIFGAMTPGWRKKVALSREYAKESNIALCMIMLVVMAFPLTLFFAARSTQAIVNACKISLDAQLYAKGEGDAFNSISLPVCQCLSKVFLDRNGIVRLALFNTSLLEAQDYASVNEADEARCVDSVIDSAPDLASGSDFPAMHAEIGLLKEPREGN